MVTRTRGRHVLPHQDLRAPHLPPDRREPLGGRPTTPTGPRHPGAARPPPTVRPTRRRAGLRRLAQSVLLLSAHAKGQLPTITTRRIGPALIFERLWRETGCQRAIEGLLDGRRFGFDLERAIFLTVLHRLFAPGSDRAADKWKQ